MSRTSSTKKEGKVYLDVKRGNGGEFLFLVRRNPQECGWEVLDEKYQKAFKVVDAYRCESDGQVIVNLQWNDVRYNQRQDVNLENALHSLTLQDGDQSKIFCKIPFWNASLHEYIHFTDIVRWFYLNALRLTLMWFQYITAFVVLFPAVIFSRRVFVSRWIVNMVEDIFWLQEGKYCSTVFSIR